MDFATSKASISPDGKQLILVSFDNEILAWDYAAQRKPKSLMTFSGQQEVSSITWSEIKNLVAIGFNGGNKATIELFNTINWNQNKGIVLEGSGVRDISFSYDGIHLAALQYHTSELHFLNIDKKTFDSVTLSNNSKHHSHGQNSGAGSVSWNHYTSQIAAGCNDGIIDIIESSDYDKKQLQTSSSQYANLVRLLKWAPGGKKLAVADTENEGYLFVFDTVNMRRIHRIKAHDKPITVLEWSENGAGIMTGSTDHSFKMWGASNGNLIKRIPCKFPKAAYTGNTSAILIDKNGILQSV